MVKLDDIYSGSGDYLKAEQLKGADPVEAKIKSYEIGKWQDGKGRIDLTLVFANGKEMVWNCNKTNGKRICIANGLDIDCDLDDWVGKKITLFHDPTIEYGDKVVGGIRVKVPEAQKTGKKAAFLDSEDPAEGLPKDEIPF